MDLLKHNLSEKEREEIKKQVGSILNDFSKKLSEIKSTEEYSIEEKISEREEGGEKNELSREIMFKNAPEKNKDFIIAEKKKW